VKLVTGQCTGYGRPGPAQHAEKMKLILITAFIFAHCFKSAVLETVSNPTFLRVTAKNEWSTLVSERLHGSKAGGILRLRGGALYGASLTRWQHSDPSITEVG
jgi:hypothetical protein